MDEFDYSVHISEQDWRSFFQECEECDLLPPRLARLDDSGMSDMDEVGSQRAWPVAKSRIPEVELQIDGPPDCEGSPVELYLSQCGLRGPERVLSGSEEDLHSETINVFFERLNSLSGNEDGVGQKHQWSVGGEMAGHFEKLADKADSVATAGPEEAGRTEEGRRKQTNEEHPCIFTFPEPQLISNKEDWSQEPVIDGKKPRTVWKCDDVNQVIYLKSDGEKTQSCALVSGSVDLANPNQLNGNSQLVANCSCDIKELEADEGQVSSFTPRRKRRRKKRVSSQPVQPDHESRFLDTHGESEDDSYVPRCEVVKETCTPGDCNSGSVSEVLHTLSQKTDIVSCVLLETHLLPGDADFMEPTVISPIFKKADQELLKSPSASVTDNPRPDVMPERDVLTGDAAQGGGLALRGESPPPECDVCTQAQEHMALQSDDSTPAPTNGDRVENHLQLNSHMPSQKASEILPVFASVCDTEKAAFLGNVSLDDREVKEDNLSYHTAIALTTHANTTALQQPTHLPSDDAVCTLDSPHSPAGEIPTESDPQANYSGTTYQREKSKATISCVTFPEITEERACNNIAEKKEGLTCMSHDKVTPELRNGHDSLSQESLSGMYDSESKSYTKLKSDSLNMVKVQITHPSAELNAFDMQITSDLLNPSSSDTIQKVFSSESKEEMKHLESEKTVILNKAVNGRLPLNSQNKDCTEEVCPFLKTKDITDVPGSKEEQNMIEAESLSPTAKATNEELPIQEQTRECPSPINTADRECPSPINTADRECPSPINTADRECPSPINTADRECPSSINTADRECPSPINTADRECPSPINTADPMKELLHVDPNPSIIITTSDEEKDQMHYANMPPPFPLREHGSASAVMQVSTYPSSESTSGVGDPEPASPASTNHPTPPLYAISSFWNEMEKLTINDILRLRLIGQSQHSGVLLQPEDSSMADASDAADSGYFTPLDDSKPDRSSGDMSFMSDFDEEFAQLQASDSAKLGEGSRESPYSGDVMWESQLDVSGTASGVEDVFVLSSETALPPPLYRDSAQQCFRKMYKNVSVQNLQTYEAQPLRKLLRNASLHSLRSVYSVHTAHSEDEHDYEDPFNRVDTPPSPVVLSDEEEDLESPGITFSEIIQYLFGTDEPDHCASVADNVADNITPSYLEGTGTSVPETYDHFFSEFEAESFFYPLTASGNDELVPIFTCARSATKTHHFPEVYDYFFPDDSPVHSDEDDATTVGKATWVDNMANESHSTSAGSDPYTNFFPESSYSWNLLWKNPLSLRRARRASCTEPPEESSSWALTPVRKTGRAFDGRIQPITTMGLGDRTFPDPLLLGLERSIFTQLAQQQQICNEMQTAVADPRADASLMPLKQADMCLVCIAFASWVLKSVNPQGADTWKAALLANVSALSAIRCLRKYMRDEANRKRPLRQIEPA